MNALPPSSFCARGRSGKNIPIEISVHSSSLEPSRTRIKWTILVRRGGNSVVFASFSEKNSSGVIEGEKTAIFISMCKYFFVRWGL